MKLQYWASVQLLWSLTVVRVLVSGMLNACRQPCSSLLRLRIGASSVVISIASWQNGSGTETLVDEADWYGWGLWCWCRVLTDCQNCSSLQRSCVSRRTGAVGCGMCPAGVSFDLAALRLLQNGCVAMRPIWKVVTWLILPVVICLSQRLSHACLSISTCTVKLRMAH